mgnify:CR=1 FL=1
MTSPNPALVRDVEERRTFAIISHPDAGKTTLTEKLLLFGGAIQMAGAVKGRKAGMRPLTGWKLRNSAVFR